MCGRRGVLPGKLRVARIGRGKRALPGRPVVGGPAAAALLVPLPGKLAVPGFVAGMSCRVGWR